MNNRQLGGVVAHSLERDLRLLKSRAMPFRVAAELVVWKYLHHLRRAAPGVLSNRLRLCGRRYDFEQPRDAGFLAMVFIETMAYVEAFGLLGLTGARVVDVGAHLGESAIALGTLLREPKIVAFEPNPTLGPLLRSNTRHLDIEVYQVGLSNREGTLPFRISGASSANGTFTDGTADEQASLLLPVAVGDSVLGHLPRIDLMKLDVEGHELAALQGLQATLRRVRHLVLEVPTGIGSQRIEPDLWAAIPTFELVDIGRSAQPHATVSSANAYFTNLALS